MLRPSASFRTSKVLQKRGGGTRLPATGAAHGMLLGMDADNDTSIAGREARVIAEFQKRQTRLFTRFALAEVGSIW